jgi:precorrin-8X/cobalt-precorrin-8 methylmutase
MFLKKPMDIEQKSFEIIEEEFGKHNFSQKEWQVVRRVIHTTADFDYANRICFLNNSINKGLEALKSPKKIYCDTQMAMAGINKKALKFLGHEVMTLVGSEEVFKKAKETQDTRSKIAMEMAINDKNCSIFVIGNAPTALLSLYEAIQKGFKPELVIGAPIGFVGAEESKEMFLDLEIPSILIRGRKGGSSVAASIINAIMYQIPGTRD